jgi:hypothetical protein
MGRDEMVDTDGSVGGEHVATSEDFTGLIWHGTGDLFPAGDNPFSTKLNP